MSLTNELQLISDQHRVQRAFVAYILRVHTDVHHLIALSVSIESVLCNQLHIIVSLGGRDSFKLTPPVAKTKPLLLCHSMLVTMSPVH